MIRTAIAAVLLLGLPMGPAIAQRAQPDTTLAPLSLAAQQRGEAALARRDSAAATDAFEAALAADPKNRAAFVGLARAAEMDGLPGKAVRFYREALAIDPNDAAIIEAQGKALVQRGATARAQDNLDRLKRLCGDAPCPQADRLAAAIAAPPRPAATGTSVASSTAVTDAAPVPGSASVSTPAPAPQPR